MCLMQVEITSAATNKARVGSDCHLRSDRKRVFHFLICRIAPPAYLAYIVGIFRYATLIEEAEMLES